MSANAVGDEDACLESAVLLMPNAVARSALA